MQRIKRMLKGIISLLGLVLISLCLQSAAKAKNIKIELTNSSITYFDATELEYRDQIGDVFSLERSQLGYHFIQSVAEELKLIAIPWCSTNPEEETLHSMLHKVLTTFSNCREVYYTLEGCNFAEI